MLYTRGRCVNILLYRAGNGSVEEGKREDEKILKTPGVLRDVDCVAD